MKMYMEALKRRLTAKSDKKSAFRPLLVVLANGPDNATCYLTDGEGTSVEYLLEKTERNAFRLVATGVKIELPEGEAKPRPRSELAKKRGTLTASGIYVHDLDFQGEIDVIVTNFREQEFPLEQGDRLNQMVVRKAECIPSRNVGSLAYKVEQWRIANA